MFNAGTLKATLSLSTEKFNAAVEATKSKLGGFGSALRSTSFLMTSLVAGGAMYAGKQLVAMAEQGAKIKDIEVSFQQLAKSAGVSGQEIVRQTQNISGALTNQQILKAANTLELLGVGMENLPKLTDIAAASARALGQDVPYMLESIATGTARQSRLWLDNLGIIVDVERANESYAKSLGKTAKQLTDTEQRAAFLNAVLAKGDQIVAQLGGSSVSAAEQIGSFTAALTDLGNEAKVLLADLAPVFGKLAEFVKWGNTHGIWFKNGKISFTKPGATEPYGTLPGATQYFSLAASVMKAEQEKLGEIAKDTNAIFAKWEEQGGIKNPGGFNTWRSQAYEPVDVEGITVGTEAIELLNSKIHETQNLFMSLGDVISETFYALIVKSDQAGRAFFSALTSAIGSVASMMGDLMISTGTALLFMPWNPAAMIAAGLALKAVSGIMQGISTKNAPSYSSPSYAGPRGESAAETQGNVTFVVQGDFNGDPVWIDRLAEKLRIAQKDRNVKLVYAR